MRAALRFRLPTVVEHDDFLEAGGLLYYDFSEAELVAAALRSSTRSSGAQNLPTSLSSSRRNLTWE
jgi:hypothetical protein